LQVSSLGYGAMVLEGYYGAISDDAAIRVIRHALDRGINLIDTADGYGGGHNEQLVARAVEGRRDKIVIASKVGIVYDASKTGTKFKTGWGTELILNGRPEYLRWAIDQCLKNLNTGYIDLLYLHFPDPAVPIGESWFEMSKAVEAGKVKFLGLSNVSSAEIEKANEIHPVAAVQFEYSLWNRKAEKDILPVLRRLGIGLVAWSPLGAGFLTGAVKALDRNEFRNVHPRFKGDNFKKNQDRFEPIRGIAQTLDISPSQLALAWLLHQGKDIVPIPGTRNTVHLDENLKSLNICLSPDVLDELNRLSRPGIPVGEMLV